MRPARRTILLLTLLGTAAAVPAFAQPSASSVHLSYAETCDAAKVTKADTDKAKKLYELASDFIKESNYDNAIDLLKRAYDTDCRAVELLLGLASVFERSGNRGEAVRALEEYLRRVPTAPDKETLEKRIRNLGGPTPTGTPSVTAPTASTTSSATTTATVPTATATATATTSTVFTPPPPTGGHSVLPVAIAIGGGAILAGGVILAIVGAGKVSSADKDCNPLTPGGRDCQNAAAKDQGNSGRTLESIGFVMGGAGILIAATGIVWHFLEPSGPRDSLAKTRLAPAVAPGYAGLSLTGRF